MRIALFSEVYWPMVSGVGVVLRRLTEAMQARGHEVRVYSASYAIPEGMTDRPEVHRSPSVPLFVYPDVQWAFPRRREIVADLRRFRPDVVHVATEWAMGLAGVKAARQLGIPIVASAHTDYEQYSSRYNLEWIVNIGWTYLRWFYNQASVVLAPTTIYESHLHRRGVKHTGIWTRGVDTVAFSPRHRSDAWRAAIGAGPEDLVVSYIGRIAREKNLELVLAGWRELSARFPTAQLALVGKGPMEDEIRRLGLPRVHVLGLATGDALSTAYASSDLFVFPSVTETFGNSLLEAMSAGLPCIAASAGGVLAFTKHGENAWMTPPNDGRAVRDAMERLMQDAALRATLREGGLRTAAERGWDAVFDRLVEDYAQAAERRLRAAA